MTDSATVPTPVGPFTVIVAPDDVVLASGWTSDVTGLCELIDESLRPVRVRQRRELGKITDAVRAYHQGNLHAIDAITVRQVSGPFIQHAWDTLRTVPPGEPVSYREFATRAGRPEATRAAAGACARNAAALFVPCHRVIRTDGTLGGFRWGTEVKQWLLSHEKPAQSVN